MKQIQNIETFFKNGTFVIPNYQRGYKWGVPDKNGEDAVSVLMDNLIDAFKNDQSEYFMQGVTVSKDDNKIILIDGQQRTTTFYLLLKYLGYENLPEIEYTIRQESNDVLNKCTINDNGDLTFKFEEGKNEDDYNLQDIFYFTKAVKTIHNKLNEKDIDKEAFKNFVLNKVKLFYIEIDNEDATKVFTMMNSHKAYMKTDELIKAKLLSEVGKAKNELEVNNLDDIFKQFKLLVSEEWEKSSLRAKYAREWDKWLYWWNRKDVKDFWHSGNNPMGLLLEYYYYLKTGKDASYSQDEKDTHTTYKKFVNNIFKNSENPKQIFLELRALQKKFEDWYNNYETYNYWGLILKTSGLKKEALLYFLDEQKQKITLEEYAKWALVGIKHEQIINKQEKDLQETAFEEYEKLKNKDIYNDKTSKETALKQLLRRNVLLDNNLGRKFDFSLYGQKSLEHIYPKSWENEEDSKLHFESLNNYLDVKDNLSVHCIGNLVLIKKNENSMFGNKTFNEKKEIYFQTQGNNSATIWSLKLLHSVAIFSKEKWEEEQIAENYINFLNEYKEYYNIKD